MKQLKLELAGRIADQCGVVVGAGGGVGVLLVQVYLERLAVLVVPVAAGTLEQLAGGPAARTGGH